VRPALVEGAAGIVSWRPNGQPFSVMGFTVAHEKIVEIDVLADPSVCAGST
jgi:RNA polymerase sigma-70 factor (ECF subfamily)